jgi:hypothetical protein
MSKKVFVVGIFLSLLLLCLHQVEGKNIRPAPSGIQTYRTLQSGCHETPTYPEPDSVIITISGNDIIVLHSDAFYNCCVQILVEVVQNGNVFNLYERESGDYCYCMCYFDVTTTIYDLEPGTYTINVFNAEGEYVGGGTVTIQRTPAPLPVLE